jgi:hypothetical protein
MRGTKDRYIIRLHDGREGELVDTLTQYYEDAGRREGRSKTWPIVILDGRRQLVNPSDVAEIFQVEQ